jgi:carboxylate-amine ligase
VGIPPHYGTWEIYSHRVEQMMRGGAIEDYTYLWWDVRPHPNLGTVEVRAFDQQTTLEHTVALAALTIALAHRMCALYDDEQPLVESPTELVDDNKVRAAVGGMECRLIDFWLGKQVPAEDMARGLVDELADHAAELGCSAELELVHELLGGQTGAHRQLRFWELRDRNLAQLVSEITADTRP